mgnify:CR=1 FL=1
MSSPLEKQTEILNNLLQIMHNSVNSYYEYLDCTFDYFKDVKSVLDLFLGSGSTLIACEQTNRICYGMELDEKYCDVIVQRWVNLTGGKVICNGEEIQWDKTA